MTASGRDGNRTRLRELDGWRAISVFLVVQQHIMLFQYGGFLSRHPQIAFVEGFLGVLGVKVFFVISGFVICRMLISEEECEGAASLKDFYYRRVFRILPPFVLYLITLSLLLGLGLIEEHWSSILAAGLFLSNIHIWPSGMFVGHIWSLAVEEQFYLTFPAVFVITSKRWRTTTIMGFMLAFVVWNLSMIYTGWDSLVSGVVRSGFICISCGVVIATQEGYARRLGSRVPSFLAVLIAVVLVIHPVNSDTWQGALYESLLVPPAIGALLLYSLERGPWLRVLLLSKPFQTVGMMSYGIYLWQQFFTARNHAYQFGSHILGGHVSFLLFPLLFVIVPLSYFCIEQPAIRYGRVLSQEAKGTSVRVGVNRSGTVTV